MPRAAIPAHTRRLAADELSKCAIVSIRVSLGENSQTASVVEVDAFRGQWLPEHLVGGGASAPLKLPSSD
jgi:hypothetical protein